MTHGGLAMSQYTKIILPLAVSATLFTGCSSDNGPVTYSRQFEESCDDTNRCQEGLFCEDSICRRLCQSKGECPSGYLCTNSRCTKDLNDSSEANCGNGESNIGEQCDDGNKNDGDGCSAKCSIEPNYVCDGSPSVCKCASGYDDANHDGICEKLDPCGNGQEDSGEQCDDGNKNNGDGCSAKCNIESNYVCAGWPSVCQCGSGYQDSNSDGQCQPDCQNCGNGAHCVYDAAGKAACACDEGYQDADSDGICQPDCTGCRTDQVCDYENLECICPEGTKDNGNGTCDQTCEDKIAKDGGSITDKNTACYDDDGPAEYRCTVFVKQGGSGDGSAWNNALSSLNEAVNTAKTLKNYLNEDCNIWLKSGEYDISDTLNLNGISIYGQFSGTEQILSQRDSKSTDTTKITNFSGNFHYFFNVTGKVTVDGITINSPYPYFNINDTHEDYLTSGIFTIREADFVLSNSKFSNIRASIDNQVVYGGVLNIIDSKTKISNCSFIDIHSNYGSGGTIFALDSNLEITASTFAQSVANRGGAIFANQTDGKSSALTIKNCTFTNNIAQKSRDYSYGGAIYNLKGDLNIDNCLFSMNESLSVFDSYGGAIWNSGNAQITNSRFFNNYSESSCNYGTNGKSLGGAIYNTDGEMLLANDLFIGNKVNISQYCSADAAYTVLDGVDAYNDNNGKMKISYSFFDKKNYSNRDGQAKISDESIQNKDGVIYYDNGSSRFYLGVHKNNIGDFYMLQDYAIDSAKAENMQLYNSIICTENGISDKFKAVSNFSADNTLSCAYNYNTVIGYTFVDTQQNYGAHRYDSSTNNTIVDISYNSAAGPQHDWSHQMLSVYGGMLSSIWLPIDRGDNEHLWLSGDFGKSSLIKSDYYSAYMTSTTNLNVTDFYKDLTFSKDFNTLDFDDVVVGKADVNSGYQPATDLFGKPRKATPDIGPFEH